LVIVYESKSETLTKTASSDSSQTYYSSRRSAKLSFGWLQLCVPEILNFQLRFLNVFALVPISFPQHTHYFAISLQSFDSVDSGVKISLLMLLCPES